MQAVLSTYATHPSGASITMAFLRTVSRCNSLVPRKVSSPSSTGTNGCLSHSRSEQFLRQYGIHAASNHRGQLSSALLAALNHRLTLEGHPSLDGTRRWRSTTVAAPSPVSTGARQRQQQDNNPSTPQRDPLDVSFNDPHAAFKSKTTFELIRAYFVYVLCSSEFLVENNMKVRTRFWGPARCPDESSVWCGTLGNDPQSPLPSHECRRVCKRRPAILHNLYDFNTGLPSSFPDTMNAVPESFPFDFPSTTCCRLYTLCVSRSCKLTIDQTEVKIRYVKSQSRRTVWCALGNFKTKKYGFFAVKSAWIIIDFSTHEYEQRGGPSLRHTWPHPKDSPLHPYTGSFPFGGYACDQ